MATKSPAPGETGINWESSEIAERRGRGQARRAALQGPATEMMLDLAEVRTGDRVLDVAAGTGDQTLLAAQRVGPNGFVLATDISASMLKLAADAAREAGLTNVETRVMDAENIDLDADSFDAVICQLGLMVFPNPAKVLRADAPCGAARRKSCGTCVLDGGKKPISRHHVGRRSPLWQHAVNAVLPRRNNVLENTFRESGLLNITVRPVNFRPPLLVHRRGDPKVEGKLPFCGSR